MFNFHDFNHKDTFIICVPCEIIDRRNDEVFDFDFYETVGTDRKDIDAHLTSAMARILQKVSPLGYDVRLKDKNNVSYSEVDLDLEQLFELYANDDGE